MVNFPFLNLTMKAAQTIIIALFLLATGRSACAQTMGDAHDLVKEGIKLNEEKKYAEAIEKYNAALKIDTGYLFADYQLASSLFSAGRGTEALAYLQKVISANTPLKAAAYELTGFVYFHNRQYAEAEKYAVDAISIDPKQATTQRMYALVCFHQNKRAAALLAFCSFILLEPNTARSAEAFGNIEHILQGGELKPEAGTMASYATAADTYALNQAVTQAVAEADKKRYASAGDLLAARLTAIFIAVGQITAKQSGNEQFVKHLAEYFYQLAQSQNMAAFTRFISQGKPESIKWIAGNQSRMSELEKWVNSTQRNY